MARVLVACEWTGAVRRAFNDKGHFAVSCDYKEAEDNGRHIKGDVRSAIAENHWDLVIAHPPCRFLCNSGVRWLYEKEGRWKKMIKAAVFFRKILNASCRHICVENPVMHKWARMVIGRRPDQTIQPYEYGHPESKATCLWLKNLPKLRPTDKLEEPDDGVWENQTPSGQNKLGPSEDRSEERSRTYEGIAKAMADQWSDRIS